MRGMTVNLVEKELPSVRIFGISLRFSLIEHRDAERENSQVQVEQSSNLYTFKGPTNRFKYVGSK